ncbi:fructose-bisphosphate aldolase [Pseudodesulfovibrio cashew]|uniref:2-amino-3,7-dideoxy-D-threo-hept-6-ulosonate synthase n=1 Tax=Pseudodesulfovibrio cashew TaxID=2678688 RepID=A0A6I6JI53_9BACT|nr:2-amino-3,7-dideoxy-D-threo-hept-6-ulosonate synthase [Pseudodesulfovibrio cashew]QGY40869.1 fructose-bisphosphate aldolase [Pseudodesulfovibrio cashew]
MHLGKAIRMERIMNRNNGRTIVVPIDHGVTVGPIYGLVDLRDTVNQVAEGGANATLMHKGIPRCSHRAGGKDIGLIIHLSGSTSLSPTPNAKSLVGTVTDALKLGADAVSLHINLGDATETQMLADLGAVCSEANEWGMPVLAMMYARGPKIKDEYAPEVVAHCARVGVELGADIVKVNYTGDPKTFSRVVDGCCVPVVIAGGPKLDSDRDLVQMVYDSIQAGGSGLSVGRNIFQHKSPAKIVAALNKVVHEDWDVDAAMELL